MTPIERARDQINAMLDGGRPFATSDAESVLKAALDVDELAQAIQQDAATLGAVILDRPARHIARAVVAHLTKGTNDE